MPNNQFSKIRFTHSNEVLTEVEHASIPTTGETIEVCADSDVILRGEVNTIHYKYKKTNITEKTGHHDVHCLVVVELRKVYEYKEDHYAT